MLNKTSQYKIIVIIIVIALSIVACIASGGDSAEVEALQQQVNALATQNAILLEERQDSDYGNDSGEVDAPAPPEDDTALQIAINTPTQESLPTEPVKAGTPIIYEGWSLTVSQELDITTSTWGLTIYVRNMGDFDRVFRFTNSAVQARDDLGNVYKLSRKSEAIGVNCEELHHQIKNLQIKAEDSVTIRSRSLGYNSCDDTRGIHLFEGPIPLEASTLIISFDNFGPFTGVEVIIDL